MKFSLAILNPLKITLNKPHTGSFEVGALLAEGGGMLSSKAISTPKDLSRRFSPGH